MTILHSQKLLTVRRQFSIQNFGCAENCHSSNSQILYCLHSNINSELNIAMQDKLPKSLFFNQNKCFSCTLPTECVHKLKLLLWFYDSGSGPKRSAKQPNSEYMQNPSNKYTYTLSNFERNFHHTFKTSSGYFRRSLSVIHP